jgi:shikimate dehydrogenase
MKITGSTKLYAVLGNPIEHSLSPILHNGWIAEHGYEGVYVALNIGINDFDTALAGLFAVGLQGANVTSPFKEAACARALRLSKAAKSIGSVNCLSWAEDGYEGDSTDGAGFIADLDLRADGWRERNGHVVLMGAGGAARALLYALYHGGKRDIIIVNRNQDRARTTATIIEDDTVQTCRWEDINGALEGASLVINATRAGLNQEDDLVLDLSATAPNCLVYDTVYAPRDTALLKSAREQKRPTLDGLGMLVGQGALAFEAWFGTRPDLRSGLKRLEQELAS